MKTFFSTVLLIFLSVNSLLSQEKFEKEYRVKPKDVPKKSLEIIKMWNFKNKVKWYAEESQDGKTFEAKVRYKKYKYSIEFSKEGNIIDVEKTVKLSQLQETIIQKIVKTLENRFKRYKILKTQIQYTGSESKMYNEVFQLTSHHKKVTINYELIVKGKTQNGYSKFEILINNKGEILKELKFKPSNSLNLEF